MLHGVADQVEQRLGDPALVELQDQRRRIHDPDVAGGPAPWQAEQAAAEADLRAAAEAAVGEGARSTDLDRQDDGGWEGRGHHRPTAVTTTSACPQPARS